MIDRPFTSPECTVRLLALTTALGLGLIVAPMAGSAGEKKEYAKNFYHDFRTDGIHREMAFFGDKDNLCIKPEPEGLRITIPKTYIHPFGGVGCKTTFGVQGDFEVTTTFEILNAETPAEGFGVGAGMRIQKEKPASDLANVARLVRPAARQIVLWNRSIEKPGEKTKSPEGGAPCDDKIGRLRMKRAGATLYYLWAPGTVGEDFQEIKNLDFGDNDLRAVVLYGGTGGKPCDLDVRFYDLRIRSGGVAPAQAKVVGGAGVAPVQPATNPPNPESRGWLAAAAIIGVGVVLLVAIAIGLLVVLRRLSPGATIDVPASPLSFACADCGKRLRVQSAMAGKKVKCTHCGNAVLAPQGERPA